MRTVIDKLIFYIAGMIIVLTDMHSQYDIIYVLIGLILTAITCCFDTGRSRRFEKILYPLMLLIGFPLWRIVPFISPVIYTVYYRMKKDYKYLAVFSAIVIGLMIWYSTHYNMTEYNMAVVLAWVSILMLLAALFGKRESDNHDYRKQIKKLRDDSVEYNNMLKSRNKYLTDSMSNEVRNATLSERNRIAREIHDNAGHMITRSILQLGAIMTVNRNEKVYEQLVPLKASLDEAMNSLRASVHDLHNESFDFNQAAKGIIDELKDFKVKYLCDFTEKADKEVKYSFITILKEAVTNIVKHSSGDEVKIFISELEGHYQMMIEDNGVIEDKEGISDGIGLINMETRITNLNGIFRVSTDKGFRIFISVPKKAGE